jgi:microcin C transport system substrate-binding protein
MLRTSGFSMLVATLLASCGSPEPEVIEPSYDNDAEVQAFFADNPERFVFTTADAIPANLDWQDGAGMEVFADPNAKRGGTLNLRLASMQQTLRITGPDANGSLRGPLWSANNIGLIEFHPWQEGYFPGLAKEWAVDPEDPNNIFLRLDPDARWSDGLPVTMEDVFFTAYMFMSPHIKYPAVNKAWEDNLARMTRYSQDVFSFTLKKSSPEPLMTIAGFNFAQREFYREFGEDYVERYHWKFSPVTGAYTLKPNDVEKGRRITMTRIDNWWGDNRKYLKNRFNPDRLRFTLVRDDSKAFESFLRGDFDWHSLTRTDLWHERSQEAPMLDGYIHRAKVYDHVPAAREGVYMNALDEVLSNRAVRLGVQHAINYDLVNTALYRSDRRRMNSVSDGYGPYSHPTLRPRAFDIEKAQEYFKQAGYTELGSDGVLTTPEGKRLSLVLTIANESTRNEEASILKTQALKAGLEIVIDSLDRTAYFTKTFEKKYQMALHGWNTGYSKLPTYQWEFRGEDAGQPSNFNTTNIQDDELDKLLLEWDGISDPAYAQAVAHGIQERVHEFAAWVPGLTIDYTRWGYWRWIQWPDYFQIPRYFFFMRSGVFWIDEEAQAETKEAMSNEETFPPSTIVYDRWAADSASQ